MSKKIKVIETLEELKAFRESDLGKKILKKGHEYRAKHGTLTGFTGGDEYGIKVRPSGKASNINPDKLTGLKLESKARRANWEKSRVAAGDVQTIGDNTFPKPAQLPLSGVKLQAHHRRMLQLYAPLYDGLSETDQLELSKYFANELGMPLGNVAENAAMMPAKPHHLHHEFIDTSTGKLKNLPDFNKPRFVDGKELKGLALKKYHAKNFFADLLQPAIDDDLIDKTTDFAKQNPKAWAELEKSTTPDITDAVNSKLIINKNPNRATTQLLQKVSNNVSGKFRTTDQVAQIVSSAAIGDPVGTTIGVGSMAMTEALQSPATQKAIAKQLGSSQALQKLLAKRAAKSTAKLVPGVDIVISGAETYSYLSQGRLGQAGIAALSGAIGWIPIVGDGASAALDLTNTGIDISRLDFSQKPDADIDMTESGKVSKYESGILHSPTGQGDEAFDNIVNALKENPNAFDKSGISPRTSIKTLTRAAKAF